MINRNFLKTEKRKNAQSGSALVMAILLIMVMTILGLGLIFISEIERDITLTSVKSQLARDIARSALAHGKAMLRRNVGTADHWTDDLRGDPDNIPGTAVPAIETLTFNFGGAAEDGGSYICVDFDDFKDHTTTPTVDKEAKDECRGCLRRSPLLQTVRGANVTCPAGRMAGVPLYDYVLGRYVIKEPFFGRRVYNDKDAILGYYTIWIRNNANEHSKTTHYDEDGIVLLVAEAWVHQMPQLPGTRANEAKGPVVARAVFAELISKGDIPRMAYYGRNIDQHNTNVIYEF